MSDKQLILNTVQKIDDKKTYEEILYTLYLQLEVQKGIKDMEDGNTKTSDDVKEISIVPRGVAGGYTMYKTDEDKYYVSKTEMEEKLISLLGGRAAEKLALNDISTGASNDIEVATKIARDMVTVYGMSEKVGPISLKTDNPYELQIFGENIEDTIGKEIKKLIDEAYNKAQLILKKHRDILDAVAQVLIIQETISQEEFEEFFK